MKNKTRKIFLFLTIIILLTLNTYALTINLITPNDEEIMSSSTVEFTCEATGTEITSMELYGDFTDTWAKNQTKVFEPVTQKQEKFTVLNLKNNEYKWTCRAIDNAEGSIFASTNRTVIVNVVNSPPVFNPNHPIPNASWYANEAKPDIFDLDEYFYDPDNDPLTFTTNGNINIVIMINSTTHIVSLAHLATFTGSEVVQFIADDNHNNIAVSNPVTFTVLPTQGSQQEDNTSQTSQNTAPQILDIPKQTKDKNANNWEINLDDYVTDNEDSKEKLVWEVSNVNTTLIEAQIVNRKLEITPMSGVIGINIITVKVTDTGNLSATKNIEIEIKEPEPEEQETSEETTKELFPTETVKNIEKYSPEETTITMKEKENKMFRVNILNPKSEIKWFWNNEEIPEENKDLYFLPYEGLENNKEYILKVEVISNQNTESVTWNIKTEFPSTETLQAVTTSAVTEVNKTKGIFTKITGAVIDTSSKLTTKIKQSKTTQYITITAGALIIIIIILLIRSRSSKPKKIKGKEGILIEKGFLKSVKKSEDLKEIKTNPNPEKPDQIIK